MGQGHVLGFCDKSEYERFYRRQKSVYRRKYHYQNKIKEVNDEFCLCLSEDQKYELYKRLMTIADDKLEKLDKKFQRKTLINIYFLIKNIVRITR